MKSHVVIGGCGVLGRHGVRQAVAEIEWQPNFDIERGIEHMARDLRDNPMRQFSSPG